MSKFDQDSSEVIIKNIPFTRWGITIIALWAVTLAFLAFANLLLITSIVQSVTIEVGVLQSWMVFGLNIFLLIAFSISAYGLFKRQQWGRLLFLVSVSIWAGFNFLALFSNSYSPNQDQTNQSIFFNTFRYAIALILPLWYLNLPQVKLAFQPSVENLKNEEPTTDDTID